VATVACAATSIAAWPQHLIFYSMVVSPESFIPKPPVQENVTEGTQMYMPNDISFRLIAWVWLTDG